MPSLKLPHQKWVLFNMESPLYTPIESVHPLIDRIDWTMTYRLDSDIYSPYGRIEKCANNNSRPNYNFKHKKKNIAWIVSHCNTFSNRETYVKKLQQFIDIDIYGSCGNLSCIRNSLCYQMIENNYKFFLSFENSLCRDYVTEKLYKFIGYDIIPIVFGGADYASLLPTNSYIDVFNFSSPQHLAAFLNEIGSDQNKYNSYFNWKNYYCSVQTHWTYFCDLCKKLNSPSLLNYNNKTNFIDWWFREANCTSRSIS